MEIIKVKNNEKVKEILNAKQGEYILDFENCEIKERKWVFENIAENNNCETLKKLNKDTFYISLSGE